MLVNPGLGLVFWTTVTFILLLVLLRMIAWKPITKALKAREDKINDALKAAEKAEEKMKQLNDDHERLLKKAKEDRDQILAEAKALKEKIIEDSKEQAKVEADRIVESARESIQFEKLAAITDLKNQVAQFSLQLAEKILKEELASSEKHQQLIQKSVDELNFN